MAYQSHFAGPPSGRMALVWVTVATGERQGAGHDMAQAWSNLLGASVPALPGQAQATRLDDARRLILRAEHETRPKDDSIRKFLEHGRLPFRLAASKIAC